MGEQLNIIKRFAKDAKFVMIRYDEDLGKIINELKNVDLETQEIHRSIKCKDDNRLFVFSLLPKSDKYIDSVLQLVQNTQKDAKMIEKVYPNIFRWAFDGLTIKGYAIVPSGDSHSQGTL